MKKKVCQIVIITLLIMSLMLVDIITLAMGIASFAVSSNKNIEFSTIFKIGEEEKNEVEKSIYSNDIRIKIEIEVKNEGCLDGVIEFANKNFKFKQEDIEGVNSITDNTISLNQINAGGKLTFDVGHG